MSHGKRVTGLMDHMDAKVFTRAAELVEQGHCKHEPALDEAGQFTYPCDTHAVAWCATGAIEKALTEIQGAAARPDNTTIDWTAFADRVRPTMEAAQAASRYASLRHAKHLPDWNNRAQTRPSHVAAYLRDVAQRLAGEVS